MCEIVMLIFGIITLIRGKFMLTRAKEVRGVPARIIGIFLVLPFPLSLALQFLAGIVLAIQGRQPTTQEIKTIAVVIEFSMVAICFLTAVGIAIAYARPARKDRVDEAVEEADMPERYHEHFQSEEGGQPAPRSDKQEVTDQPPRPSARPDDRIRD
jgi:hypothetical protein